jgi:hypothetical protein
MLPERSVGNGVSDRLSGEHEQFSIQGLLKGNSGFDNRSMRKSHSHYISRWKGAHKSGSMLCQIEIIEEM